MTRETAGAEVGGVLVFSESATVVMELLAAGRPLADALGGRLISLDVCPEADGRAADEISRGADEVLLVLSPDACPPRSEALIVALQAAVEACRPAIVLVGATRTGTELAARLAQRLSRPCASGCMSLSIGTSQDLSEILPAGTLVVQRRVYGGRFVAEQSMSADPKIATVQLKRFEAPVGRPDRPGKITPLAVSMPPQRMRVLSVVERERSSCDITKSEVIVAAGRGVKNREDLALIESLARELGGALAGSRPLTDDLKWLPMDCKVGLSGQTVRPRLYVACGISGQIEHMVGARPARTIVAINTDAAAPIHAEADYSVVGDLYELLPALIRFLSAERSPSAGHALRSREEAKLSRE